MNVKFKKMKTKILLAFALATFFIHISYGQDTNTDSHTITVEIPEVALVDIEPSASKDISLEYTAPTEAGNPLVEATNSDLWLNYSS